MIAVEFNPDMVAEFLRTRALGRCTGMGGAMSRRRTRPAWNANTGVYLLVRWRGERLPLATIDPSDKRAAEIVGVGLPIDDGTIRTWSDVTHAANTTYHLAVVPVSGGGVVGSINPMSIVTRTIDGGGAMRSLAPNAPSAVQARVISGARPLLSWSYSAANQQVAPEDFAIYAADEDQAIDFSAEPVGAVNYVAGQTRYSWQGDGLTDGDIRNYIVRARTKGVLSLIPQRNKTPSGEYASVNTGYALRVAAPAGAAAAASGLMAAVAR